MTKKTRKLISTRNLAIFCMQLCLSSSLYAHYELDDFDIKAHSSYYNSLPSVEENDKLLKQSPQFQNVLKEAEEIITKYELNDSIGLRLIHRHYLLNDNQVMAEAYNLESGTPSLVTAPYSFEETQEIKARPSSWIFGSNSQDISLFETSTDFAVRETSLKLQKSPEFFEEMGEVIRNYQMKNLLSLAVLKRKSLFAQPGQVYLEINSTDESKSIVQIWNASEKPQDSIITTWSFKGPQEGNCIQEFICRKPNGGEHEFIYRHR